MVGCNEVATKIESVVEPNGVTDDIEWESVSFVYIHGPILSVTAG